VISHLALSAVSVLMIDIVCEWVVSDLGTEAILCLYGGCVGPGFDYHLLLHQLSEMLIESQTRPFFLNLTIGGPADNGRVGSDDIKSRR